MPSVFISGASTGIGHDVALRMAGRGWRTFGGVRSDEDAEHLIDSSEGRITPVHCDITESDQISDAAHAVAAITGGTLTGLVNNAGIVRPGHLEILPIDDLRDQLEVNVVGQLEVTQAFLEAIRAEAGRIVNIGSISGIIGAPGIGAYAMSKFALEAFNDVLRRELEPWNISVSLIQSGPIDTPIWAKTVAKAEPLLDSLETRERIRYGPQLESMARRAKRERSTPVSVVTDAVEHALVSRRPKTRYRVGPNARIVSLLDRLLPDRGMDLLLRFR